MCSMNEHEHEHEHERLVSLIVSFNERTNEHAARAKMRSGPSAHHTPATTRKRRGTKWCVRGDILRTENGQCRSKCRGMIGRRTNRWEAASGRLVLAFLEAHEALINCTTGGSTFSRWGDECSLGLDRVAIPSGHPRPNSEHSEHGWVLWRPRAREAEQRDTLSSAFLRACTHYDYQLVGCSNPAPLYFAAGGDLFARASSLSFLLSLTSSHQHTTASRGTIPLLPRHW